MEYSVYNRIKIKRKGELHMIKASIIGSTGYTGYELVRLLSNHDEVELVYLNSRSYVGTRYSDIYPALKNIVDIECSDEDIVTIASESDVIFLALPHGISSKMVTEEVLEKSVIIDLGADFRLDSKGDYEEWYKTEHFNPKLLEKAVYGLPEINKEAIKNTRLLANPGCYTTASILALYPLISTGIINPKSIIIDAKSGVTGAGRSLKLVSHYVEANESFKAYSVGKHRHTIEIEQELIKANSGSEIVLNFTPHLVPMSRGILATIYADLTVDITEKECLDIYNDFYRSAPFTRVIEGILPEVRHVKGSNFCDISIVKDDRTNRVIIVSAIDNLVKGASGQAIQNMNIIFGFKEDMGLKNVPLSI